MRASWIGLGLAVALGSTGCDQIQSLFEPSWKPVDTNGDNGAVHFGMNPFDLHVGLPEHIRIDRVERRTITKPGGAKEDQERERNVTVVLARCRPAGLCNAKPHSDDTREVVVEPLMIGDGKLEITVALDGKETMNDSIKIHVAPN